MAADATVLAETESLCPNCLERVPGRYEVGDADDVYLARTCPEHGPARRRVWGSVEHWRWARKYGPDTPGTGDYTVDPDHACLGVVDVTEDCNLSCSYCFASSAPGGRELSRERIEDRLRTIKESAGVRPIQLSGGEPTVRDDLPEIVETARAMGFEHVEVNTNGLAIARRDGYAEALVEAGVTGLYLQFDGLTRSTYETLREVDLLDAKLEAIESCRAADLPVVLVPTVVAGVNDDELGDIVRFALENLDVVQSVNCQPAAQFGRHADQDGRFPIDAVLRRLADQLAWLDVRDLYPVPCCSSYCQFGTALVPQDDGALALTSYLTDDAWDSFSGFVDEGDWMEALAGTRAGAERACDAVGCCGYDVPDAAAGLFDRVLPLIVTGFMDADAADAARLDNCCLSVPSDDGELVPFCAYNMTTDDGEYAIRNRNGWGGRASVGGEAVDVGPMEASYPGEGDQTATMAGEEAAADRAADPSDDD